MEPKPPLNVLKFGIRAAIAAACFSIIYDVGQLAEWLGGMGSGGGPDNASNATGLIVLLTPSLFLGPSFLAMMVSIHQSAPAEKKIWTHTGIAFAIIYTTLISINYFVQLTLVVPHMLHGETESVRFLLFKPFDSFLYSVDILGYSFMSLSTLFAAFAFRKTGKEKSARLLFIANGLLLPFIALQNYYHLLIWAASLWGVLFPWAMISLAILFKNKIQEEART